MTDTTVRNRSLYEEDLFLWTREQARLLRERRFDEIDLDNLIDEVEGVGRADKREIRSRLAVLIAHLLRWRTQPGARLTGWRGTIDEQRRRLAAVIDDSPSLRGYPAKLFKECYLSGCLQASRETGIDFTLFPEAPPFTIEQALDDSFLPKEPDLYDQS